MTDASPPLGTRRPGKKGVDTPVPGRFLPLALPLLVGVPGWSLCNMADDVMWHFEGVPAFAGAAEA